MRLANLLKLNRLLLLLVLCLMINKSFGVPLYRERFPEAPAKIVLPDPLTKVETAELPMVHNNNYDMIMPDYSDHAFASSMHYQTFQEFFDPEMIDDGEYNMDETKFIHINPVRAPQPLSEEERRIRQKLEDIDEKREKKQLLKLKKGSTKPRFDAPQWDQFDYDLYSMNPYKKYKNENYL